jgi:hypothetical protein
MAYTPIDDNRKFTELYNVQRLASNPASTRRRCASAPSSACIPSSRKAIDEAAEEINPAKCSKPQRQSCPWLQRQTVPEFFDFIVIDECHRSIYNLWQAGARLLRRQPDRPHRHARQPHLRLLQENIVSEYSHEQAVADGVNVGNDVYLIETEVTQKGADQAPAGSKTAKSSPAKSAGSAGRRRHRLHRQRARPRHRQPGPDPHRHPALKTTNCRRSSPAAKKSPKPSSSPRPTATPTTSSRPCARNSAKATPSAKRSPTAPRKTPTARPQIRPRSSSATTTTRASPSPWT